MYIHYCILILLFYYIITVFLRLDIYFTIVYIVHVCLHMCLHISQVCMILVPCKYDVNNLCERNF